MRGCAAIIVLLLVLSFLSSMVRSCNKAIFGDAEEMRPAEYQRLENTIWKDVYNYSPPYQEELYEIKRSATE